MNSTLSSVTISPGSKAGNSMSMTSGITCSENAILQLKAPTELLDSFEKVIDRLVNDPSTGLSILFSVTTFTSVNTISA